MSTGSQPVKSEEVCKATQGCLQLGLASAGPSTAQLSIPHSFLSLAVRPGHSPWRELMMSSVLMVSLSIRLPGSAPGQAEVRIVMQT